MLAVFIVAGVGAGDAVDLPLQVVFHAHIGVFHGDQVCVVGEVGGGGEAGTEAADDGGTGL